MEYKHNMAATNLHYIIFGQAYGSDTYGSCQYQTCATSPSNTTNPGSTPSSTPVVTDPSNQATPGLESPVITTSQDSSDAAGSQPWYVITGLVLLLLVFLFCLWRLIATFRKKRRPDDQPPSNPEWPFQQQ